MVDQRTPVPLPVQSFVVVYRPNPVATPIEAQVVEELEPVGYLRVFRRVGGDFLHVAEWDVLTVDGVLQ